MPQLLRANTLMRSIGLGQMNLHGFLAQNKIAYESEEAKDFANTYFMMVNFYSLRLFNKQEKQGDVLQV